MVEPRRIQRKRTKGWRMPEGAIYVGRPSRWGNSFKPGETFMWIKGLNWPIPTWRDPGQYDQVRVERCASVGQSIEWYRAWITNLRAPDLEPLIGYDLACWCPLDQPCHADVLLELANR